MMYQSPKEFMKNRRPNRFSDSVIVKSAALNRSMLDQHLETLTTRNQESEFAEFVRKLCELEIMPNLRPQTGPVGGGDSKVDSENIPVSSETQLAYFQGEDNQSKELFALTISAKKKWTDKARSDVRKAHSTNRGYARIYFVTNQPARDKTRSEIEKEMSDECGVKVIILDKNWILDRVFTNKREKLAIEALEMGTGLEEVVEVGPLDLQRRRKLEELNTSIEEAVSKKLVNFGVVDDSLDAALLVTELGEPRTTFDGQFERAIRIAREYGNKEHLFTALYQRAWSTFFWFEDFKAFIGYYDEVEALALESHNIFSIERLSNLWSLLRATAGATDLVTEELLNKKAETLRGALSEVIANEASPSAAVQAEAMLCLLEITQLRDEGKNVGDHFKKLKDILDRANILIGFPFETIVGLLGELDIAFSGVEEYENLQEYLLEITTKRRGEIPAGELLFQRGIQHLKAKRFYKAIDCLGRSLHRFFKQESKDDLVRALAMLALAYEQAGLLWAARNALLNAASHATSDFWKYNEINTAQLRCYERLKLIELQLGRIGASLDWHNLHIPMSLNLATTDEERNEVLEKSTYFGMVMGLLIIKTREEDLKALEKLPETLVAQELDYAAFGLAYRLGGKDNMPSTFPKGLGGENEDEFFNSWLTQPAHEDLPDTPDYYLSDVVELRATALGCDFVISTQKTSPEIDIAEYIAGALESFLSTAIELGAMSRDSSALINITRDEALGDDISYEINTDGKIRIDVKCGNFNPHSLSIPQQEKISSKVSDIVLGLIARAISFEDADRDLKKLFKDEEVNSRAFSFSSPLIRLGNVLGYNHKRSITDWIESDKKAYPYIQGACPLVIEPRKNKAGTRTPDTDRKTLSHKDIKNASLIRMHLWDDAKWKGAFYMTSDSMPPVLGLLYEDEKAARNIFKDWRESLGERDEEEKIRITVARGIEAKNPTWYRIGIGTNVDKKNPPSETLMMVTRLHTMTPDSTANIDRFMESYKKYGFYLFAPAFVPKGQTTPEVIIDVGIVKKQIIEKNAWEIGPEDIDDIALITPDTKPFIPEGVVNAPVIETLKNKKLTNGKKWI